MMTRDEVKKILLELWSYEFAFAKFGIASTAEQRRAFAEDRMAHVMCALDELFEEPQAPGSELSCAFRASDGAAAFAIGPPSASYEDAKTYEDTVDRVQASMTRLQAGEVVGLDDDGPIQVEYHSRYPQPQRCRDPECSAAGRVHHHGRRLAEENGKVGKR